MQKKRILLPILTLLLSSATLTGCNGEGDPSDPKPSDDPIVDPVGPDEPVDPDDPPIEEDDGFDDENVILKAPLFSDEHCERTSPIDSSAQTTASIKKFVNLVNETEFDAWLSLGDRSLTGTIAADKEWINAYEAGFEGCSSKMFFTHGNHDVYWSGCASREEHYNYFNSIGVYDNDEEDGQPQKGNRHKKINGIDFISVDVTTYDGKNNPISTDTKEWAKSILSSCDKTKPVFVLSHCTAPNTVIGSCDNQADGFWGSSPDLYDIVKDYSNVILLSGHTHYDCHDERAIWQGGFTAVQVPTLAGGNQIDTYYNGIFDPLYTEDELGNRTYKASGVIAGLPESEDPKYNASQGMYLQIDKDYNVKITRYDLKNNAKIKKPWVIPAPKLDNSHLTKFTDRARMRVDEGPMFKGKATYSVNNDKVTVNFDAFTHQDMIYAYEVQMFRKDIKQIDDFDTPDERIVFMDEWYKTYPLPKNYEVKFNGTYSGTFVPRIIALDSWGKYSIVYPELA